jgi:hypothetical protein
MLPPCGRDCARCAGNAPSRGRGSCAGSRTTLAGDSGGHARASHRRRRRIPQAECARAPARRGSAFVGRGAWRRRQAARRRAFRGASRGRRSRSAAPEPIVVAGHLHTPPELPGSAATGQGPHSQPTPSPSASGPGRVSSDHLETAGVRCGAFPVRTEARAQTETRIGATPSMASCSNPRRRDQPRRTSPRSRAASRPASRRTGGA